jgi:hypothetical protein
MIRFLLAVVFLKLLLIPGCDPNHNEDLNSAKPADVYLNGTLLNQSADKINSIIKQTDNVLAESDDYFKLIVTPEMIKKMKGRDQFLEIDYRETRYILTDKFGKIEFSRILIPLSGRFALSGQLTIFYGITDYSTTAMLSSKGPGELNELLIGMGY